MDTTWQWIEFEPPNLLRSGPLIITLITRMLIMICIVMILIITTLIILLCRLAPLSTWHFSELQGRTCRCLFQRWKTRELADIFHEFKRIPALRWATRELKGIGRQGIGSLRRRLLRFNSVRCRPMPSLLHFRTSIIYIYIYIYMHACMYTYVYVYVYIYIYIYCTVDTVFRFPLEPVE